MTPEEALEKLEGKNSRSGSATLERKISPSAEKPQFKEETTKDVAPVYTDKTNDFIRVFVIVLILGGLILGYLWRLDIVSKDSYRTGFNDGVASLSPNLTLAQKDISDKLQQVNQLQQDLESLTQQKDQLVQSLKKTQESLPRVEQQLEGKIKRLTDESQNKISNLNNQLSMAQRDIGDKKQQLATAQKDLNDKLQQMDKLQQDLKKSKENTVLLQQEMAKLRQELKPVKPQKK